MAPPKGQNEQGSQEMALLAAATVGTIAAVVIWYFYRAPIVYFILGLNWLEVQFIALIHGGLGEIGSSIQSFMDAVFSARREASLVKLSELGFVMEKVGAEVRVFVVAIILGLAVWCLFRMRGEGLKRHFDLSSLAAYQATHWKVALTSSNFDPASEDEKTSPALKPMEWLQKHNLPLKKGRDGNGELDEKATAEAFTQQLGDTYVGLSKMPIHTQALAVTFNLSKVRDKRVLGMKEKLTEIWTLHERAEAEKKTAELLAPYLADKKFVASVEKELGAHAFINTAMMGMFETAKKEGGVLACAEILWLKPVDRTLWYTLQNVGRHAYYIEGAGSRAHYFAERVSGTPKIEPYVSEAVYGLKDYLIKQGIPDMDEYLASRKKKK
jgi:intracellular multiplication protein IcmP